MVVLIKCVAALLGQVREDLKSHGKGIWVLTVHEFHESTVG